MISSKFYLITGDSVPIYVGYTNRSINQRLKEHKQTKDFSKFKRISIKKIDQLDYEFTWDEKELYMHADEVSKREGQLVLEYKTQDSEYQKAIGGGQTWSDIKWLVKSSRDNPGLRNMSDEDIKEKLKEISVIRASMKDFIINLQDPVFETMKSFMEGIESVKERRIRKEQKTAYRKVLRKV